MPPIIPTYTQPDVQAQGIPNVKFDPGANAEDFGAGQSTQDAFSAIGRVGQAGEDIAINERQKAVQVQHAAKVSALTDAVTQIGTHVSQMYGEDAFAAPDYAKQKYQDAVGQIQKTITDPTVSAAFQRSSFDLWNNLNRTVQTHVAGEKENYAVQTNEGLMENFRTAAVQNAFDGDMVDGYADKTEATAKDLLKIKGVPADSPAGEAYINSKLSTFHTSIIQSMLDKDTPNGVTSAREYFNENSDEFTADERPKLQKALEAAETTQEGVQAWNDSKHMVMPDGNPDMGKIEASIMNRTDVGTTRKLEILRVVKQQARDQYVDNYRQDNANTIGLMNKAIELRKQGASESAAQALVPQFSRSLYQQSMNASKISTIFTPPDRTDPAAFNRLWDQSYLGKGSQTDIDKAVQNGQITSQQSIQLHQMNFKAMNDGEPTADQKYGWQSVNSMAEQNFSSTKDRDNWKMVLRAKIKPDMPSEQIIKIANDSLQNDPNKGWLGFGTQAQWKTDKARIDTQNQAWGQAYQDLGQDTVNSIGSGALQTGGQRTWGLPDVENFAKSVPGYDPANPYKNIKPGTPAGNAIQSLKRRGWPVVPENVEYMLKQHPDGNF